MSVVGRYSARPNRFGFPRITPTSARLFVSVGQIHKELPKFSNAALRVFSLSQEPEQLIDNDPAKRKRGVRMLSNLPIEKPTGGVLSQCGDRNGSRRIRESKM